MSNSIYSRRSIRKYLNTPVPKEMIEQVIDAARMAPSARTDSRGNILCLVVSKRNCWLKWKLEYKGRK